MNIIKCPYCNWESNPKLSILNYPSKQLYNHFKEKHPEKLE